MNSYKPYNTPRKNMKKNYDTKIEDYHPYIAELVNIMPKYRVSGKNCSQFLFGDWIPIK